jgi:hypothetical protein
MKYKHFFNVGVDLVFVHIEHQILMYFNLLEERRGDIRLLYETEFCFYWFFNSWKYFLVHISGTVWIRYLDCELLKFRKSSLDRFE